VQRLSPAGVEQGALQAQLAALWNDTRLAGGWTRLRAGVKPTRMYLRRVAAWPVKLMSIHRAFRLRSFRNLIMDTTKELLTVTAKTLTPLI